jgi:hypothetical protein
MSQHCAAQTQLQNTVNILNMHVLQAVPAFSKDRIPRTYCLDELQAERMAKSTAFWPLALHFHCC